VTFWFKTVEKYIARRRRHLEGSRVERLPSEALAKRGGIGRTYSSELTHKTPTIHLGHIFHNTTKKQKKKEEKKKKQKQKTKKKKIKHKQLLWEYEGVKLASFSLLYPLD